MDVHTRTRRAAGPLVVFCLLILSLPTFAQTLARPAEPVPGAQGLNRGGAMARADTALNQLFAEYRAHVMESPGVPFRPGNRFLQFDGGRVAVEARAAGDGSLLFRDLERLGLEGGIRYGRHIAGTLPVERIERAAALASLQSLSAAMLPIRNVGSVTSQGDVALRADVARSPGSHDVDGTGVSVGVLSDSYDLSPFTAIRAADDVATGDLPAGDPVLPNGEYGGCGVLVNCIDEGRAMLQIIHDLAPGADLLFHTALASSVAFASGISDLVNAGADVVVDDVVYLNEPMFQDGIIAQAADDAAAAGVAYFSAAGNSARRSWEAPYVDSGEDFCIDFDLNGECDPIFELVGDMHDFDPGAGVDVYQNITIPVGSTLALAMQWDAPFGNVNTGDGPDNDHIIVLLDHSGGTMLTISANDNVLTGEPYEILQYNNFDGTYGGPSGDSFNLVITYDAIDSPGPPAGLLKTVIYNAASDYLEYGTSSPSLVGHANAAGAIATGAAYWDDTPEFGTSPPLLEPFSSAGGVPILFDIDGTPLPAPVFRAKPEIVATDGVSTTFFFTPDTDGDGFPDFFGTSAAAPHAAAIAALMFEAKPDATPQQIRDALQASAIDMGAPGFDDDSGFGLIQADAAITSVLGAPPGNNPPDADFSFVVNDLDVDFTDASQDADGTVVAWNWDFGDGNGDNVQNPSHSYASAGTYSVTLTATDDDGDSDVISKDITVSEAAGFAIQVANGQSLTWGSVSGGFADTHANDGTSQAITEESTRGNPSGRVSRLRFEWVFDVAPGAAVTLYANTWASLPVDGDQFEFSWSTDGTSFTPMFQFEGGMDDDSYHVFALPPATSGTVLVRVEDTDRTAGNTFADTVFVDHIYIRTDFDGAAAPPDAPTGLSAIGTSASTIDLGWTDNSGDELGFHVERSLNGVTGWVQVATTGIDTISHTDMGLSAGTTYFYRVQAFNSAGSSGYSGVVSATTLAGPPAMHVADLDGSASPGNGRRWNAQVTIRIENASGTPVADATVSGDWSAGGKGSCITDAAGSCQVDKGVHVNDAAISFVVTDVSHATLPYDPGANTDPDGDSDGTTIVVTQP